MFSVLSSLHLPPIDQFQCRSKIGSRLLTFPRRTNMQNPILREQGYCHFAVLRFALKSRPVVRWGNILPSDDKRTFTHNVKVERGRRELLAPGAR
jgi:hypothetical protein